MMAFLPKCTMAMNRISFLANPSDLANERSQGCDKEMNYFNEGG